MFCSTLLTSLLNFITFSLCNNNSRSLRNEVVTTVDWRKSPGALMSWRCQSSWRVVMFSSDTSTSSSPRTCSRTSAKSSTCPTHRSCHREPMPGPGTCFLANQRSVKAVQFAYSSDPDTRRQSADLCGGLRRKLIGYCVFNFCLFLLDFNYRRLFWYSR